jgi:hypothetical protein
VKRLKSNKVISHLGHTLHIGLIKVFGLNVDGYKNEKDTCSSVDLVELFGVGG